MKSFKHVAPPQLAKGNTPTLGGTHKGITLAEVLLAMAVIAVIATFNVQKLIIVTEAKQNKATMKETISAVHQVLHEAWLKREITPAGGGFAALRSNLNYAYACAPNDISGNCEKILWSSSTTYSNTERLVMANGQVIFLWTDTDTTIFWMARPETNKKSNAWGSYEWQAFLFNGGSTVYNNPGWWTNVRPGDLRPGDWFPEYQQEYNEMFGG
jgi:prepilin-type N-terminal cleavage/methylation domain-containing protein